MYETPGHAPSHVVLHQPDRGLLLSGDHILGRVSLYYDFGYTPDPAGEFLDSASTRSERLDVDLMPRRATAARCATSGLIEANRSAVHERVERVRQRVADGPQTPFEIVPELLGVDELTPMLLNWGLSEMLCYLRHLELRRGGRAARRA